ncbi:Uu.00g055530.m01.CDS01 [Anthostomella pinea]|uniref:Uu.00g055530.m01.CDS01 n=1 Tax=Anthostomella pinea TaxID=933095 RepID=A0AAI8VY28_9PEZI|nr:Uu.00g055530.m01.CDS01 [Anthostomella pinea]
MNIVEDSPVAAVKQKFDSDPMDIDNTEVVVVDDEDNNDEVKPQVEKEEGNAPWFFQEIQEDLHVDNMAPSEIPTKPALLTPREIEILAMAWVSCELEPKVNFAKLADNANFKNPASARACFAPIKNKIMALALDKDDAAKDDAAASPSVATPRKRALKDDAVTPKAKKPKTEAELKKPKTPKAKAEPKTKTEDQAETEDEPETKTKAEPKVKAEAKPIIIKDEDDDDDYDAMANAQLDDEGI